MTCHGNLQLFVSMQSCHGEFVADAKDSIWVVWGSELCIATECDVLFDWCTDEQSVL